MSDDVQTSPGETTADRPPAGWQELALRELQQQRGALQAATAQLEAMKLHVESKHTNVDIILTPRGSSSDSSTGSNTSLRTSVGYPTQSTR